MGHDDPVDGKGRHGAHGECDKFSAAARRAASQLPSGTPVRPLWSRQGRCSGHDQPDEDRDTSKHRRDRRSKKPQRSPRAMVIEVLKLRSTSGPAAPVRAHDRDGRASRHPRRCSLAGPPAGAASLPQSRPASDRSGGGLRGVELPACRLGGGRRYGLGVRRRLPVGGEGTSRAPRHGRTRRRGFRPRGRRGPCADASADDARRRDRPGLSGGGKDVAAIAGVEKLHAADCSARVAKPGLYRTTGPTRFSRRIRHDSTGGNRQKPKRPGTGRRGSGGNCRSLLNTCCKLTLKPVVLKKRQCMGVAARAVRPRLP